MNDAERALRGEIIRTCLAMEARGINQGTSGNVSARWGEGLLITPSGLGYATMAPEDIIFLEMDGTTHGPHAPSTEWRFHRDIMRERSDVQAIVHAHPPHLTGLSILNRDIPAVHYMIAAVGGPSIRCAPYATYGTEALSKNALAALEGRSGCILANHGVIACGPSLARALWLAGEMETLAQQYVIALSAGKPVVLPDEEIANVMEKFKSYGPRRKDEPKLEAAVASIEPPAPEPAGEEPAAAAPEEPVAAVPEEPVAAVPKPKPRRAAARKSAPVAATPAPARRRGARAATKSAATASSEAPPAAAPQAEAPASAEPAKSARGRKTAAAGSKGRSRKAAAGSAPATAAANGADNTAEAAPAQDSEVAEKAARKKPQARRGRAARKNAG